MASAFRSLGSWVFKSGSTGKASLDELFPRTDPATDGDDCLHDCESCTVRYPRNFKIEESDKLYGGASQWSTHLLVGTGKADWVRDVADEKGSVMQAVGKASGPSNGKMMLSASDMPTPSGATDYSEPTTVLLLPAFTLVDNVRPDNVTDLIRDVVEAAPTTTSPMDWAAAAAAAATEKQSIPPAVPGSVGGGLFLRDCPHRAVILMCSQRTRDVRCGQSAPLLRRELERHLRPLGLYRDLHDERPGGVGIYFISHVGGHKYSANVMVYRRHNAFGQDDTSSATAQAGGAGATAQANGDASEGGKEGEDKSGAAQCIWLARVKPEDCENLVRYTVLKGKVVKPETQLRGGFNRERGLISW